MNELIQTAEDVRQGDFARGAMLLIDKPSDWTSFDVVNKVRGTLRHILQVSKIKVGHSGTLDPAATGLLILCTGKWTRRLHELQGLDKCYDAVIELGAVTASYDGETEITKRQPFDHVTSADVERALQLFTGHIEQVPPMYSAIKVKGTPLYRLARRGEELELKPRPVHIRKIELTKLNLPEISLTVHCSKGTYIRSLAHDIGAELGCGAYLKSLRRTAIGPYSLDDAWQLESLVETLHASAGVE